MSQSANFHQPPASAVVVRTVLQSTRNSHLDRRRAKDLVWHWVARRWPALMPDRSEQEDASISHALPGRSLRVTTSDDGSAWVLAVCSTERDGLSWTTTTVVAEGRGADVLAIETRCADAPRVVAPPKVLSHWVERLKLEDAGIPIRAEPVVVEPGEDVDALCRQLLNAERRLPVVALANRAGTRWYGIDPRGIAESLGGLAHVVCVSPPAAAELAERFGRPLAPVTGAVRVYLPGFDAADESRRHPLIRQRRAPAGEDPGVNEATVFRRHVCRRVCELGAASGAGMPQLEALLGRASG